MIPKSSAVSAVADPENANANTRRAVTTAAILGLRTELPLYRISRLDVTTMRETCWENIHRLLFAA
jgi:hypothetical protein